MLVLSEGMTQDLDDTAKTAEAKHSINLQNQEKDFCCNGRSLHCNKSNIFLPVNAVKMYHLKIQKKKTCSLCLGNAS